MNPLALGDHAYRRIPARTFRSSRGQSLVEFALVFPILMLLVGGIIQFGLIFWAQNTLTQVVRDTGRWAATQQDCANVAPMVQMANDLAAQSSLFGYQTNSWTSTDVVVTWQVTSPEPCPPLDNSTAAFVTIRISHTVPIFFPLIPGGGALSSSTQYRMEPAP